MTEFHSWGQMRAADHDRAAVMASLGSAYEQGRLSLDEYDERVRQATRARRYGELAELTEDLPAGPVDSTLAAGRGSAEPGDTRTWVRGGVNVVFLSFSVWLVMAVTQGVDAVYPWWIWVAAGWGVGLLGVRLVHVARSRAAAQTEPRP